MEMMNRAIEDARDFRGLMEKIKADAENMRREADAVRSVSEKNHYVLNTGRQPGENRAAHRARLKRERREAKKAVA